MDNVIQGSIGFTLFCVCIILVKMLNGKLRNKVSRPECHQAQEGFKSRIDDLRNHIDVRFDDIKDYIDKNGRR